MENITPPFQDDDMITACSKINNAVLIKSKLVKSWCCTDCKHVFHMQGNGNYKSENQTLMANKLKV
ncbi:hypothetical protein H5410_059921 [Solanum commersonii]|uniref:Uncharacterized protein n=1 Tax=Solanum commersonii TaxID=4109 RepID=A0A9J5W3P6_SOLCO|nr:hypothetical protein H5410_059921 [Solanum commersonii]